MVFIVNDELGGPWGPVSIEAFEERYKSNGWDIAEPAEYESGEAEPEGVDLSKLTRDELDAVARSVGVDPTDMRNKGEVAAAIESATNVADRSPTEKD